MGPTITAPPNDGRYTASDKSDDSGDERNDCPTSIEHLELEIVNSGSFEEIRKPLTHEWSLEASYISVGTPYYVDCAPTPYNEYRDVSDSEKDSDEEQPLEPAPGNTPAASSFAASGSSSDNQKTDTKGQKANRNEVVMQEIRHVNGNESSAQSEDFVSPGRGNSFGFQQPPVEPGLPADSSSTQSDMEDPHTDNDHQGGNSDDSVADENDNPGPSNYKAKSATQPHADKQTSSKRVYKMKMYEQNFELISATERRFYLKDRITRVSLENLIFFACMYHCGRFFETDRCHKIHVRRMHRNKGYDKKPRRETFEQVYGNTVDRIRRTIEERKQQSTPATPKYPITPKNPKKPKHVAPKIQQSRESQRIKNKSNRKDKPLATENTGLSDQSAY